MVGLKMARYNGSGWHFQSVRHSNARKTGRAGGDYASKNPLPAKNKNLFLKQRTVDKPYEIWTNSAGFEWRVLKKWQTDDDKPYARWFCAVKSPYTFGGYDYGDVYVKEIKDNATKLKDSDGDGVPDKYDCQPKNPNAQADYKTFQIGNGYEIVAHWEKTRSGFRHIAVLMKDGQEIDKTKVTYQNRTWESYEFETAIKKLLDQNNSLSDAEKKTFLINAERKDRAEVDERFGNIAKIAKMGEFLTSNKKESNDWKKRMIKAGLGEGIQMPEDWDNLSEDEKETRLNAVISHMNSNPTGGRTVTPEERKKDPYLSADSKIYPKYTKPRSVGRFKMFGEHWKLREKRKDTVLLMNSKGEGLTITRQEYEQNK